MSSTCLEVRIFVFVLVVIFGMGSWIAVNVLWVELPILVDHLPEGWSLPSYMAVVIQIANIGPIAVTTANLCVPNKIKEQPIVYSMVLVGSAASILLAFLWKETSFVAGEEHSTALMILVFFLALVGCSSSVVFLPFMNIFKPQYVKAYFVGIGFSGLVPSLVAFGQGVGKMNCLNVSSLNKPANNTSYSILPVYLPPNFSVEVVFIFLFAMMVTCEISFILLNYLPYCKKEHVRYRLTEASSLDIQADPNSYEISQGRISVVDECQNSINPAQSSEDQHKHNPCLKSDSSTIGKIGSSYTQSNLSTTGYFYFFLLNGWINALLNGILPSIQSFSCLPYGTQSYHVAVTLSNVATPVGCFITYFLPVKSQTVIGTITAIGSLISVYVMVLAVYSPTPPLVDTVGGSILAVASYVVANLLLTFSTVTITALLGYEGKRAIFWCGAVSQLGSAVGAAVMFVFINIYEVFLQKYPCT